MSKNKDIAIFSQSFGWNRNLYEALSAMHDVDL